MVKQYRRKQKRTINMHSLNRCNDSMKREKNKTFDKGKHSAGSLNSCCPLIRNVATNGSHHV